MLGQSTPTSDRTKELKVWRSITLGRHKTQEELMNALLVSKIQLSHQGKELMGGIEISQTERRIELVKVNLKDLHLDPNGGHDHGEIIHAAAKLDLWLCPAEVGPQLRLQYQDQPEEDALDIASEKIGRGSFPFFVLRNWRDFDSKTKQFVLSLGGVSGGCGYHGSFYGLGSYQWVFCKEK